MLDGGSGFAQHGLEGLAVVGQFGGTGAWVGLRERRKPLHLGCQPFSHLPKLRCNLVEAVHPVRVRCPQQICQGDFLARGHLRVRHVHRGAGIHQDGDEVLLAPLRFPLPYRLREHQGDEDDQADPQDPEGERLAA